MRTTIRNDLTQVRTAIIKNFTNNRWWRGCGEKGTLLHSWWESKLVQSLWRTVLRFLKKLKIELLYDSGVPLQGKCLFKTIFCNSFLSHLLPYSLSHFACYFSGCFRLHNIPLIYYSLPSVQFSSVAQSCLTLCDPMNCSTSRLPVHHQLPESTQTHIH